ncbi:hypothetical protein [Sphingomonas montana]|uniref:hypothetical protein n=1 Tax=Sphingomonas montana TaxID=1843236 RepID=UPI00096F34A5|nr:hypothetical protein [Sphingomonas montana]
MTAALLTLRKIWPYLAIVAGLAVAYFWIDHRGYARGKADVEARHAEAVARILADAERIRIATDKLAEQVAASRTEQVTTERTIYRDAIKIIDRPVYLRQCMDADGVQLLDRARDSANRGLTGEPADAAADASLDAAQR